MRALIIGELAREEAARVLQYARANRLPLDRMRAISEGRMIPPTFIEEGFHCEIPMGFRCSLTIEEHPTRTDPAVGTWLRHLSVSVDTPGRFPLPAALAELAPLFGFSADPLLDGQLDLDEETESVHLVAPYVEKEGPPCRGT